MFYSTRHQVQNVVRTIIKLQILESVLFEGCVSQGLPEP